MGPGFGTATVQFNTDSGSANPTGAGVITLTGANGITTSGAANTVTISITTPIPVTSGGTGNASFVTNSILIGEGTNPIGTVGPLSDGQLLIGSTGLPPVAANLTAGTNISISNGGGTITINANDPTTWNDVTGTSASMVVSNGYLSDNAGLVTLTLPVTAAFGTKLRVAGFGAGGWKIAQNAGQLIHLGNVVSTVGVAGHLDSTNQFDAVELLCVVANTTFLVLSSIGNISIT